MEAKLNNIMTKLENLDLAEAMEAIIQAAKEGKTMAAAAREVFEDPKFKDLPGDISETMKELKKAIATLGPEGEMNEDVKKTLKELRAALASVKAVADILEEKPNALIFGKSSDKDDEEVEIKIGPRHRQ